MMRRCTLLLSVLALLLLQFRSAHAGFSYGDNTGLPIRSGDPLYDMLAKAAADLKQVNPQAGAGIEDMLRNYQLNRGVGDDADQVGGLTLPDGRAGTAGDRINISENWLNGGGTIDSSDASTWSGSCWNQLLGVLAHEWVHANTQGMPIFGTPGPLADFLWEFPAMAKEMQVLEALGEPTGFYTVYLLVNGQPLPVPIKTRHEYIRQKLKEKLKAALEQLRKWLQGVFASTVPTDASEAFFVGATGASGSPTLMEWCVEGATLWGISATQDGGYVYDLPMAESYDFRAVSDLPLGSDHAVAFVAGSQDGDGVIVGLELSERTVVAEVLRLTIPGCVPESISYRDSDHSLWILDTANQRIHVIRDTDTDGVPDSLAAQPYATAAEFPQLAEAHAVTARFDHPGVGISPAGFLPVDVFPTAQPLVFLVDDDEDGEADSLVAERYGTFTTLPPAIADRPNAGAAECTVFGTAGTAVTVGGCDAAGSFSGEVLGAGIVGPDYTLHLPLARALIAGEHIRAYDETNDPEGESPVYLVPPAGTNRPPVPSFAQLQLLTQTCPSGAMVTLDASTSYDPDGDALSFSWQNLEESYSGAPTIGIGATLGLYLPQGFHVIRLIVSDGAEEVWSYAGVGVAPPPAYFPDVPGTGYGPDGTETHWAFWEVEAARKAGIVAGFPDGAYRPGLAVSRDEMAVYVSRALAGGDAGVPTGPAEPSFTDVPPDHWAYDYIEHAFASDVVQGYDDNTYRPDLDLDRGQMAVFIARAIATPTGEAGLAAYTPPATPTFTDVAPETDWAWCRKYVEYLAEHDVTHGYPDGLYHPEYICARDQMAVYIARAFDLIG